jgi:Cu/Ag efflux pump CusA
VEREGVRDAMVVVQRAAIEQLSPILMTALAAGLALIPLALRCNSMSIRPPGPEPDRIGASAV